MKKNCEKVTGYSLPPSEFSIPDSDEIHPDHLLKILAGKALGVRVRSYLKPDECQIISENFQRSTGLHRRQDCVKGVTVGADHFGKDWETYRRDTRAARGAVDDLFAGAVYVPTKLRVDIQRAMMPSGTVVRVAAHDGIEFNHCRGVGWTDTGEFALKLHDDLSQLNHPRQQSLETARVVHPVAFNVYPSVTEEGGELEVVNVRPDAATKRRLGIEHSGYPYPAEGVEEFEHLVIKPQPGDLVIIAGSFVHGVRGIRGPGVRVLLNTFGGLIDDQTFVTWS